MTKTVADPVVIFFFFLCSASLALSPIRQKAVIGLWIGCRRVSKLRSGKLQSDRQLSGRRYQIGGAAGG